MSDVPPLYARVADYVTKAIPELKGAEIHPVDDLSSNSSFSAVRLVRQFPRDRRGASGLRRSTAASLAVHNSAEVTVRSSIDDPNAPTLRRISTLPSQRGQLDVRVLYYRDGFGPVED